MKFLLTYRVNELNWHLCFNEHEDVDQYGSFAIPSKIMPYQSYPESLVNQNEIPIELFTNMKMLTNLTHMQNHPT